MSKRLAPPPRPLSKQRTWSPDMLREEAPPPQPRPLLKQQSWSPDMLREEAWHRRRLESRHGQGCTALRRSKSVTNEDVEELKGCIELGFGFDSPEIDPKLADTLPALEFYYAVNKQYGLTRSSSASSLTDSDAGSSSSIIDTGEEPEMVKTRIKQWAQVVACSLLQSKEHY